MPFLRLDDGRILKNVTFANFRPLDVLLRHSSGTTLLRYEFLPESVREAAEARRPGAAMINRMEIQGQVFVQTAGSGSYKFGNVTVYAFDLGALQAWTSVDKDGTVHLPRPLCETITDGDGKFKLKVPADSPFFIFCQATRLLAESTERDEWRLESDKIKRPDQVFLSNDSLTPYTKKVDISRAF